jgi:pyruvate dehydrogenase E1 component alpha subunit/2-oxoisovalerate dehydrogenase E1 component
LKKADGKGRKIMIKTSSENVIDMTSEHAHDLLYQMILIRRFENKTAELYSAMKIRGFLHLYNGQEAIAAGVMPQLEPGDAVVATYREHAHALMRGITPEAIMAEMYGRQEACSRGRGGSMQLFDAASRFYGGNAIVGGGLPLAVGLALADQMQGNTGVTCCFFGEGALAEGEFHESMNLAALWKLPVLFVCENNYYAMGTALERSQSVTDLIRKVDSYAIESAGVDGMDVTAVEAAARAAVTFVRGKNGPFFLECRTYRFRAHSMFDPQLYRDKAEVEGWKKKCPILSFVTRLKAQNLLTDEALQKLETDADQQVEQAVAFAESGTLEPVAELERFVYSEGREP